jgi:hypothetical protein
MLAAQREKNHNDNLLDILKVVGGLGAGIFAVYQYFGNRKAERQRMPEAHQHDLLLKIAEIAMQAPSPDRATQKVGESKGFGSSLERRSELLALLAAHPQEKKAIVQDWATLFPHDVEKKKADG